MDTYYNPEDLAKFGTIGEKAPELAETPKYPQRAFLLQEVSGKYIPSA